MHLSENVENNVKLRLLSNFYLFKNRISLTLENCSDSLNVLEKKSSALDSFEFYYILVDF